MQNKSDVDTIGAFPTMFERMITSEQIREIGREYHSGRGAPSKIPVETLIGSCVYHEFQGGAKLEEHLRELTGLSAAASTLAERMRTMDERVFVKVMDTALKAFSDPEKHPQAFYHGLRLLGVDGYEVSLPNTEAVARRMKKARARGGKAAYAKMRTVVLSELALHNPIAASIGGRQESEMELARPVLARVPPESLTLGDRYYGVGKCISDLMPMLKTRGSFFLFRVRDDIHGRLLEVCADGSRRIEVETRQGTIQVREILGEIFTRSGKCVKVRLWTNLMDVHRHPAGQLLELYSSRWELEIATDELKNKLGSGPLLKSQSPHTAVQEMAALIMAQGIAARVRSELADQGEVGTLRVSFGKTLRHMHAIFLLAALGADIISKTQFQAIVDRVQDNILHQLTKPRRQRSCQRAVRQPISKWPKTRRKLYHHGKHIALVNPF
jgi:hypothetical protein